MFLWHHIYLACDETVIEAHGCTWNSTADPCCHRHHLSHTERTESALADSANVETPDGRGDASVPAPPAASSKLVRGNPTEYYRRAGSGSSLGAGIKLGAVRAEYATEGGLDNGTFFLRFGERY